MPRPPESPTSPGRSQFYATPAGPSSPSRSVEDILHEKREAAEALLATAASVHEALLAHGIDVTIPQTGQTGSRMRLPLSYFDNLDFERNDPQGWVKASRQAYGKRPNAIVLLPDGAEYGGASWQPGRVTAYDPESATFAAAPVGMDGRALEEQSTSLPRLSVMFLLEKVGDFTTRVALSHRARDECEGALLLSFYIKNMPTEDVRTLNELQVARLIERTLTTSRLRETDVDPNALIDEVKLDYARSVNGACSTLATPRAARTTRTPTHTHTHMHTN